MSPLLHDLVSRQAKARPGAVAVACETGSLTYEELDHLSSRLAAVLAERGVGPGSRVCLLLPKDAWAVVAIVGTLKTGACYVPLDPDSPVSRLAHMVESTDDRWLLTTSRAATTAESLVAHTPSTGPWIVGWLDRGSTARTLPRKKAYRERRAWRRNRRSGRTDDAGSSASASAHGGSARRAVTPPASFTIDDVLEARPLRAAPAIDEDALAYVMFTSGSTGVPKGVTITHGNVRAFIDWALDYFGIRPGDRVSSHPPLHFDLSVFDLFGAAAAGAELHLVPTRLNVHPPSLAGFIRDARLTQWFSVPSVLNYMMKTDCVREGDFPSLKRLLWCGEVLPTPTLVYLMERLPHVRFTNLYGPTEATIASSYYTVPEVPGDPRAAIPIGIACPGESLLVLDADLDPVEPGEIGDLYIAGAGLSPGYWRDPERTDEAFVWRAGPDGEPVRIYRTGDLARVGPRGMIEYVGRTDTQIKSRGYRIELGEIETALHAVPELEEAAVVAVPTDGFEGWAICCAYVPRATEVELPALTRRLREWLPAYMIPQRWQRYERLPKNANGKIDRPQLKEDFTAEAASVG